MAENNNPVVNTLPASVICLFLVIVGVEGFFAGAEANLWSRPTVRFDALQVFAFSPDGLEWLIQNPRWQPDILWRFFTYPFVHGAFLQAMIASVFLLALGKFVGEVLGNLATLLIFFLSAIGGVIFYTLILNENFPIFGGFPPAYGLIGAYCYVRMVVALSRGESPIAAFRILIFLVLIQVGFATWNSGPATWLADLGGAITGFVAAIVLQPGGLRYLRRLLQRG